VNEHPPSDPRTVVEPTTGRPILLAPRRQQRPHHTGPQADARACPFCQGNEAETPPELAAVREPGSRRDGPGWTARAFPNKYPANAHHEVIAEGAPHCEQPADLDRAAVRASLQLCRERVLALETEPGIACAFLFKNVGAVAGASIAHNHSQILGLAELPPRLLLERDRARGLAACPWCATMATAERDGRLVFANATHAVLAPEPPKLPNETWLLPRVCDDDFATTDLDALAEAMHALFLAVANGLARPAFNLWLHRVPRERFHWHFELQPRTGQMAGLELGGDMYINAMPAATSAAKLRAGLATR
jgi:UDPglucose--hexose-1-phosphate uridylyltransferase